MAVRACKKAAAAARWGLEVELAQTNAASKAASEDAARIINAGEALRASHVDDVRVHHAVVACHSGPTSPAPLSGDVSEAHVERSLPSGHVVTAPAARAGRPTVASAPVPTGRADSREFAVHQHTASHAQPPPLSRLPASLRAELPAPIDGS